MHTDAKFPQKTSSLRVERRLRTIDVMVNEHLPTIEEPAELELRLVRDVSVRASVLSHVIGVGMAALAKRCSSGWRKLV